jgi:hypothetical protein
MDMACEPWCYGLNRNTCVYLTKLCKERERSQAMVEVYLPQLFPTMRYDDTLTIKQWYVEEGDIVEPNGFLLEVDAPPGFISIPVPPSVAVASRVVRIVRRDGEIHLGDLLVTLEPISSPHA